MSKIDELTEPFDRATSVKQLAPKQGENK